MFIVVWRFEVKPEHVQEFQRHYASDGTWAVFFRGGPGFVKTELLRDLECSNRFLTLDYWGSQEDYARFQTDSRDAYEQLDREFARLTLREERIGTFTSGEL